MTPNKRKNGFEYPRSAHQLVTVATYWCTFGLQFALIIVCIKHEDMVFFQRSALTIHGFLGLWVFFLWLYCTAVDPECLITDKPIPECSNIFGQKVERTNLFCMVCNKRIYGMDHHCVFLNNCIGSRNYGQFIALLIFAGIHMMFDTSLTIYLIDDSNYHNYGIRNKMCMKTFQALLAIQIIICALFSVLVFALLGLHIFLNFVAFRGTFNWVLYRRELRGIPQKDNSPSEDQPNIMKEISDSISSRIFRDRSRNYTILDHQSFSKYRKGSKNIEEGIGDNPNTLGPIAEAKLSPSKKNRLYRSELLKQKATSTIYPETPLMTVVNSESNDHEEQVEIQLPPLSMEDSTN